MSENKNIEFVINLDKNVNDLLCKYKKHCSSFALLPALYKINYVVICISVAIMVLSCVVITEKVILGVLLCVISGFVFLYTNCIHLNYLKANQENINDTRYQYLSNKLNIYNSFALKCLNERIQIRREKYGINIVSLIIATFAVIALPIWECYVSLFFEKNIVGTESDLQIKSFFVIAVCSIALLSICIGVYVLSYSIKDIFCKDGFYNNLSDIIRVLIELKENADNYE